MIGTKRQERVLVAGTNPLIAEGVERAAGKTLALYADVATDGWEAIEKLRTESYAAIVIDTDLPRHSGYGVITWLREEVGDDLENVVVVTSADRDTVRQRVSEHVCVIATDADAIADAVKGVLRP